MNLPECDSLDSLLLPRQQPDNAHFQARLENAEERESKTMKNLINQKAEGIVRPASQAMFRCRVCMVVSKNYLLLVCLARRQRGKCYGQCSLVPRLPLP